MNQTNPATPDVDEDNDDGLFSTVPIGVQPNGCVTDDIGWAGFQLFESLGIEPIVGIAGFDSADHFKQWFESAINVDLDDWEPVEVDLYQCWMPCLHDQFPYLHEHTIGARDDNRYEGQYCYISWREVPDTDAIKKTRKTVFALRHIAYTLKPERGVEFLHSARNRSWSVRNNGYP